MTHFLTWVEDYCKWTEFDCSDVKKPSKSSETKGHTNVHSDAASETKCWICDGNHFLVKCPKFINVSVDKRWETAKKKNLCFSCLGKRHKGECQRKRKCDIGNCGKYHHRLLHQDSSTYFSGSQNEKSNIKSDEKEPQKTKKVDETKAEKKSEDVKEAKKDGSFAGTVNVRDHTKLVHFRIIPAKLFANGKCVLVNAFFDEGSSQTLVTQKVANELGIKGTRDPLSLVWTDNTVKTIEDSEIVSLEIAGMESNSKRFIIDNVRTVNCLNLPKPTANVNELKDTYEHLKGIDLIQPFDEVPRILIGLSHAKLGICYDKREGKWNEPIATKTRLGWVVHGCEKFGKLNEQSNFMCVVDKLSPDVELHNLINGYFNLESFGVRASSDLIESKDNIRAKEIWKNTLVKKGTGYEIGLLWKADKINLPDNKDAAMRRFLCFEKQMVKDKNFGEACYAKFKELIDKGYFKKLTAEEEKIRSPCTWYLPVFAVKNPNKPKKIRLVYDFAFEFNGTSLNSQLLKGPDMLKPLLEVVWKSRQGKIVVTTDADDQYHRVKLRQEDQDAQRVFFRFDPEKPLSVYKGCVELFGSICASNSVQFVKDENAKQFMNEYPRAVECITDHHYADDALDSFNSEEEAVEVAKQVTMIQNEAGFKLKNWISNSKWVMEQLNGAQNREKQESLSIQLAHDEVEKILGLFWIVSEDMYTFKLNFARVNPEIIQLRKIPTKRELTRTHMSVYDPLGMLSPVMINMKILLQDVWRAKIDWDELITEQLFKKWCFCIEEIKKAECIKVPRCYFTEYNENVVIQLHTFCDAGESGFACVSYFRFEEPDGGVKVSFIQSKCKVAPLKELSIPRKELLACVLGSRLADSIVKGHSWPISKKYFWTDSETCYKWINSDHRNYKQFVANKISEILDYSSIEEWNWIPGKLNVADDATKYKANIDLSMSGRWFGGVDFLKESAEKWNFKKPPTINEQTQEEIKRINVHFTPEPLFECLDNIKDWKWHQKAKVIAYVMRFINNARNSNREKGSAFEIPSPNEIRQAEQIMFKKIQHESFANEIQAITQGNTVDKKSRLKCLSPILDSNGVLRLKGRIDAAPFVNESFKQPIILDRHHYLTDLLIRAYHERFFHANTETVVAELRQRFWIIDVRAAVKHVSKKCQECKNRRAMPEVPEMSPLPEARLMAQEKPFSYVGLDYFGPIIVTIGRRHEKRWGALFTCLVIRAVHLELVSSLDTNSCIMATRNLMLRRGPVKLIISDNGTSMHGAETELRKALAEVDKERLREEGQIALPGEVRTEWKFISPLSPHMGGAWERMVKSVKSVLYACLKEKAPKEEVLRNFLIEAEYTINSRPLTYQSIDPDTLEPLTPNMILQHGGQVIYSPCVSSQSEVGLKPYQYSQHLADMFWKRWIREYLPVLTKRTKWFEDGKQLAVGDIIVIVDENAPRNLWKKGIIEQIHPSVDGKVRSVTIKTFTGVYKRPVAKLARLDVRSKNQSL